MIAAFVRSTPARPQLRLARLTAREHETLRLLASELSNAEIADTLVLPRPVMRIWESRAARDLQHHEVRFDELTGSKVAEGEPW